MKKNHTAEYFTDDAGRRLVRIPVTGSDRPFITEAILYDNARQRGHLTGQLFISASGKRQYVYAWRTDKPSNTTVARMLIDAPPGYQVRYNDGDTLSGLPENLRLVAPWADDAMAGEVLDQLLAAARQPVDGEAQGQLAGRDDV